MPKKKKKGRKKRNVKMNGVTTTTKPTDKTTVNSETNISYVTEKSITETINESTDNTESEYESDEETTSAASSDEEVTSATAKASKRKTSVLSSPELQPQSKVVNLNTAKLTPEEEQSLELTDSERLIVDLSQTSDKLNSTHLSDTTNVTKDLDMDISDVEPREDPKNDENGPKIMESYTLVLPTLKEIIDKEGLEGGTK